MSVKEGFSLIEMILDDTGVWLVATKNFCNKSGYLYPNEKVNFSIFSHKYFLNLMVLPIIYPY